MNLTTSRHMRDRISSRTPTLLLVIAFALSAHAQQPAARKPQAPANQTPATAATPQGQKRVPRDAPQPARHGDAIDRPVSEPYTGDLSIFEDAAREQKLQINRVMDILNIRPGANVADIGAGSGWFTVRAARRVGADGQVYAVEINQQYLDHIAGRAKQESLANIRTVLGREDDPLLPRASVDAVMILKTYHEISEPVRLLRNLKPSLKTGARLGIIDRDGTGGDHGIKREDVIAEATRAGYKLVEAHDFVKPDGMDYFLVFEMK